MTMLVPLKLLAAVDDCMQGVDMEKVERYRAIEGLPPIMVRRKNKQGFYTIKDGHHRTTAAMLNGKDHIEAIEVWDPPFELSWRWPRIAPVLMTKAIFDLVRES